MTAEPNSPSPEPEPVLPAAPPPLPPRLELTEIAQTRRKWTLELHPDHFSLQSEIDPQPLIYTRAELWQKADVMEGMRLLTLKKPRSMALQLTPEDLRTFQTWLKPSEPARLRTVLSRRYSWTLLLAVLIGVSSLPLQGDAAAGKPDVPWNPVGAVLAGMLVLCWLWAKFRPMRVIFLCDAAWFTLLAMRNFLSIVQDNRHWGWGAFGVFLLWLAFRGVLWFRRFSPK